MRLGGIFSAPVILLIGTLKGTKLLLLFYFEVGFDLVGCIAPNPSWLRLLLLIWKWG